jgi:hypothetical protein
MTDRLPKDIDRASLLLAAKDIIEKKIEIAHPIKSSGSFLHRYTEDDLPW